MEHLLPTAWQDRLSPITIPYFQDADQDYDQARFENLCDLTCELGDHDNEATTTQQMQCGIHSTKEIYCSSVTY